MSATLFSLAQAAAWLPGARIVGAAEAPDTPIARVHTDTRSLQPGDLFVALRGERFDGNDYLAQAKTAGAVAALAERLRDANGERWLSTGKKGEWNVDDTHCWSAFNFDGWRYIRFPLPGQYAGEGYHWPDNSQWKSSAKPAEEQFRFRACLERQGLEQLQALIQRELT